MAIVTVVVLRALLLRGERQDVGMPLDVDPLTAADLLATGRAVLRRPTDAAAVRTAVEAHNATVVKQSGSR